MTYSDRLIGRTIDDRYLIQKRLARGGMATVYLAYDQRLEREVAVKLMHPHIAESADFIARFHREARAAAKLTHPGVVAVYDQGAFEDTAYLVMEYVPGQDLRSLISSTATGAPIGTALKILDLVIEAVGAAHRAGLVHRDIKPENVLVDSRSSEIATKVTDFGLARAVTEATMASTGTLLGTVAYMAPEIITKAVADPRSDVYACGIILYELLLGHPPFQSASPMQIAYQHVNNTVPAPSLEAEWIPSAVDELILAFTHKDPDARPANADAARALLISSTLDLTDDVLEKCQPLSSEVRKGRQLLVASPVPQNTDHSGQNIQSRDDKQSTSTQSNRSETLHSVRSNTDKNNGNAYKGYTSNPVSSSSSQDKLETLDLLSPTAHGTQVIPMQNFGSNTQADRSDTVRFSPVTLSSSQEENNLSRDLVTHQSGNKPYVSVPTKEKPNKRKKGWLWTIILILLIAGGTSVAYWFTFGPGAGISVPNIVGVDKATAAISLEKAGLQANYTTSFSDTIAENNIISTNPSAGTRIKTETVVEVLVSKGVEKVVVPRLVELRISEVNKKLKDARLNLGNVVEQYHDTIPEGQVISQTPSPNASVPHDSEVGLVVSKGREPVVIPDLSGKTTEEIKALIDPLGLTLDVAEAYHDTVPAGKTISQQPSPGDGHRGDTVHVVVSKGPELVEVPRLRGMSASKATEKLKSLGFKVKQKSGLLNLFGIVSFQSEKPGSIIPKGSVVEITID